MLKTTADKLSNQAQKLQEENKTIGSKRFIDFDVYECHRIIENLLKQSGFVQTHTSSKGDECITQTEVWTLEE